MNFLKAVGFLTIIPSPLRGQPGEKELGRSSVYFPVVGLILGFILVGLDRLMSLALPSVLANALLIVSLVILSGGLHLDGLADTCDGVALNRSPQERLRVMSDSHIGAFGMVGVCCLLILKYASLSSVPIELRSEALIVTPVLGRWAMVCAIFAFPCARREGMGWAFKQQVNWQRMSIATLLAIIPTLLLVRLEGLVLMAVLWLIVFGAASYLRSRLGGLTGDTYGTINEVVELVTLILLPIFAGIFYPL